MVEDLFGDQPVRGRRAGREHVDDAEVLAPLAPATRQLPDELNRWAAPRPARVHRRFGPRDVGQPEPAALGGVAPATARGQQYVTMEG